MHAVSQLIALIASEPLRLDTITGTLRQAEKRVDVGPSWEGRPREELVVIGRRCVARASPDCSPPVCGCTAVISLSGPAWQAMNTFANVLSQSARGLNQCRTVFDGKW